MNPRSRFTENFDEMQDNQITIWIKKFRYVTKDLQKALTITIAPVEEAPQVAFGSMTRFLTCVESCLLLMSHGYIGTANAMLRQMYEFLIWAKLGLSTTGEIQNSIRKDFYNDNPNAHHSVTKLLKNVKIDSQNSPFTEAQILEFCKQWFNATSAYTHATGPAQQNPYKNKDFYSVNKQLIFEIRNLLWAFLCIFKQYSDRLHDTAMTIFDKIIFNPTYHSTDDDIRILGAHQLMNDVDAKLYKYYDKIMVRDNSIPMPIAEAFKAKWSYTPRSK